MTFATKIDLAVRGTNAEAPTVGGLSTLLSFDRFFDFPDT